MWRRPTAIVPAALLLAALSHCGKVVPNLENGARCSLNSDCKTPLVCGFERCRAQCATSRDCGGKLCVRSDQGGNVCQLDDEVQCTHNSECTGTQLCGRDGHCRDVCITDKDCVTDLLCVSRTCARPDELVAGELPNRVPSEAGAGCIYATDCPGDLVCLYGTCDLECLGEKDCLVGWRCNAKAAGGDGRCYPRGTVDAGADATLVDAGIDAPIADASDASPDADAGPPPLRVTNVLPGGLHTCATFSNAKVKCWGYALYGQVGLGDTAARGDAAGEMGTALAYVDIGTGRSVKQLSAGGYHTCAVLDDDKVKCWGRSQVGQLGLGDLSSRGVAAGEMGDALVPVDLGTGRTAKAMATALYHTCVVLDNAQLKCWGANESGQLGQGDIAMRGGGAGQMGDALANVSLGTGRTVKTLALGYGNSSCALLDNAQLKCWGANGFGQLGLGDTANRGDGAGEMGDALLAVDLGVGRTAKAVALGATSMCAILDNDTLKCWGANESGQLGLGDTANRGDGAGEMGDALPAVDLGTGRTAKSIAVATSYACALLDNAKVKCWGAGQFGQLGSGDTVNRGDGAGEMGDALPYVDLGTGRTAKAITASYHHTCALLDNDEVKCWGYNFSGQLGLGDKVARGDMANQMGDALPYVNLLGP